MIRPLDLQTLYMNLEKVGKETAQSKEAQSLAQAAQVEKLQKEHDQGQHAVGRTNPTGAADGETKVRADGQSRDGRPRAGQKKTPEAEEEEQQQKEETWKDPQLGKHVDLSG